MVSFMLCDAARDAGAVIAAGTPVARILPGEGVELVGGERIFAPSWWQMPTRAPPYVFWRRMSARNGVSKLSECRCAAAR